MAGRPLGDQNLGPKGSPPTYLWKHCQGGGVVLQATHGNPPRFAFFLPKGSKLSTLLCSLLYGDLEMEVALSEAIPGLKDRPKQAVTAAPGLSQADRQQITTGLANQSNGVSGAAVGAQ